MYPKLSEARRQGVNLRRRAWVRRYTKMIYFTIFCDFCIPVIFEYIREFCQPEIILINQKMRNSREYNVLKNCVQSFQRPKRYSTVFDPNELVELFPFKVVLYSLAV